MKYTVKWRMSCNLVLPPNRKSVSFGQFTLLRASGDRPDIEYIQTTVDVKTPDEAKIIACKVFEDFFTGLTLIFNSRFYLREGLEVISAKGKRVVTPQITTTSSIVFSYNVLGGSSEIENLLEKKKVRKTPIGHYRDAINEDNPFEKYKYFYKVLEFYFRTTFAITSWVKSEISNIQMKKDKYANDITILSWIRHKLSHSKSARKDLAPLSISNPKDVKVVKKHLPLIQKLSKKLIHKKEGV